MIYNFRHKETGEIIEESMSLKERETFLKKNKEWEQVLLKAPAMVDPFMLGRMNDAGKSFQKNVVNRMKAAIPRNNLGDSRFGKNITEI